MGTGKPVSITDASFQKEVLDYSGTALVDCWAPWCGPCRMLGPVLDELAAKYRGRVKVAKINTDENPGISNKFVIKSIPTMLIFKNGKQVDRLTGALPKAEIERHLTAAI
jgi:thioredoxin 2